MTQIFRQDFVIHLLREDIKCLNIYVFEYSSLAKMTFSTKIMYPIVQTKPKLSLEQKKEQILLCFPNIGRVKAKKILQNFGNLKSFFLASASELKKAGIGKKTKKAMVDILQTT